MADELCQLSEFVRVLRRLEARANQVIGRLPLGTMNEKEIKNDGGGKMYQRVISVYELGRNSRS